MPLEAGRQLGPYQIVSAIGAGGMGEVYKARDTRLDRTVAIKVLPEHVASDPDLQQRFEREAKTISSLNHPHICTLYDVGEHEGTTFLVMEYLEGDTLAQRLKKEALPLDQALTVAIEIADALDKAHRQGITHRDLKPGNIMLTKAGAKLLDFGLAKLKGPDQAAEGLTALPTQDAPLTQQGAILGTFQYMAPEQLEGKEADHRTDIFAFGAVVYEMVTGQRAFEGDSQASLIHAIMGVEPPLMSSLQTMAPTALDYVVKTCLAKDPDDRWQSAGDVKRQVIWIGERGSRSSEPTQTGFARRTWRPSVGAAVASLLIGAALAALAGITVWSLKPTAVRSPELVAFRTGDVPTGAVALSPDGMRVVFSSGSNLDAELSVHRLDELDATPLRGTQGGSSPFFSPDGEWVAFMDMRNGDLRKVPSVGGQPETICNCDMFPTLRGQSWGPDGSIVFGMEGSEGLWQVPAVGGEPELLTRVDSAQEMDHRHPWILPNGKAVLFTAWSGSDESSRIALASMETGEVSYLMAGSGAQYTQSGHVVYGVGRGTLRAVGFDAERGELTSDNPVPVLENVAGFPGGMPNFSVSDTGSMAYVLGYGAGNPFVWVDSGGGEEPLGLPALLHLTFQLSPGDDRIAVEIDGLAGNSDISVYDLESSNLTQLTSSSERECCPLWSPDGARVVFTFWRDGAPNLYSTAADGSGSATRLTDDDLTQFAYGWLDGGTTLLLIQDDDLYALRPDGRSTPTRLLRTEWREERPTLSPNGRWIAFESERAGPRAVEVRALADVVDGSWWTVSPRETGTYDEALWSPDGRQLFFRSQTEMMVVPIETGPEFRWGPPEPLFPYPGLYQDGRNRRYEGLD